MTTRVVTFLQQTKLFLEGSKAFYQPLSLENHETRLVQILPGSRNNPIAVKVVTVSLKDRPHYETISYTWGDTDGPREIDVEGLGYLVTVNQYDVLQHFRDATELQTFWMDVISINQADDDEKAQQVAHMDYIYSLSQRTRVWLGSDDQFRNRTAAKETEGYNEYNMPYMQKIDRISEELEQEEPPDADLVATWSKSSGDPLEGAFAILDMLAEDRHLLRSPCWQREENGFETPQSWVEAVTILSGIVTAKWWSRVWVIQEVVLSSEPPVFHVGSHTISYDVLQRAADSYVKHVITEKCCLYAMVAWGGATSGSINQGFTRYMAYMDLVVCARRERDLHPSTLLALVLSREATRLHDYIYGVAALWDKEKLEFPGLISYARPVADIYASVTWSVAKQAGGLDVLAVSCGALNTQLPSWVRDWSFTWTEAQNGRQLGEGLDLTTPPASDQVKTIFQASNTTWDQQDNSISVLIRQIGTVDDLSIPYPFVAESGEVPDDYAYAVKTKKEVLPLWWDFCRSKHQPDRFWELVFRGWYKSFYEKDLTTQDFEEWHHSIQHWEERGGFVDGGENDAASVLTRIAKTDKNLIHDLFNRQSGYSRLFSTETHLGSGHKDTMIGDIVVAVAGSKYVYILRPQLVSGESGGNESVTARGEDKARKSFRLVAPCYVLDVTPESWDIEEFNQRIRIV